MGWLVTALAVAVVVGILAPRSPHTPAPPLPADDGIDDLVARGDQVELLRRYGTADDVVRLTAEGHGDDLAGLGYRGEN